MTRGTNSLANVQKKSHFSGRLMDKGATDDTGKSSTPDSSWSMTAAHEIQDEENIVLNKNR